MSIPSNTAAVMIINLSITNNGTNSVGGGVYNNSGVLTAANSVIGGNFSNNNDGGGIYNINGNVNLTDQLYGSGGETDSCNFYGQ